MKLLLSPILALSLVTATCAQAPAGSDHVAVSLPTAVLSTALVDASGMATKLTPQAWLSIGATLSVVAVYEEGGGFSWLLERPADGARFSVHVAGRLLDGVKLAPGNVVSLTSLSAGALLSIADQALAFIPSRAGESLLHHERASD